MICRSITLRSRTTSTSAASSAEAATIAASSAEAATVVAAATEATTSTTTSAETAGEIVLARSHRHFEQGAIVEGLAIKPLDGGGGSARIVVGDGCFAFPRACRFVFEEPNLGLVQLLVNLIKEEVTSIVCISYLTRKDFTLMTPMDPKNVSISDSVTVSGSPETKTLSSMTMRSSPFIPPPPPLGPNDKFTFLVKVQMHGE